VVHAIKCVAVIKLHDTVAHYYYYFFNFKFCFILLLLFYFAVSLTK
jgi:hypothetical protein